MSSRFFWWMRPAVEQASGGNGLADPAKITVTVPFSAPAEQPWFREQIGLGVERAPVTHEE